MPKFPGDTVLTETSVNSRHLNILHFTCVSFRDHLDKLVPEQQTVQHSSTTLKYFFTSRMPFLRLPHISHRCQTLKDILVSFSPPDE